jgi:hypothetical protein
VIFAPGSDKDARSSQVTENTGTASKQHAAVQTIGVNFTGTSLAGRSFRSTRYVLQRSGTIVSQKRDERRYAASECIW